MAPALLNSLEGEAPQGAPGTRAGALGAVDSPGARISRVRRVQHPTDEDLRRVCARVPVPEMPDPLGRTAHHEAGHVVVCEHYGIRPLWARVDAPGRGAMDFCREHSTDPEGRAALAVASIYAAGLAAELLSSDIDPGRVLMLRNDSDFALAREALHEPFPHMGGAHWYAQRLALHILSVRWARVIEIAAHLCDFGYWTPDPLGEGPRRPPASDRRENRTGEAADHSWMRSRPMTGTGDAPEGGILAATGPGAI